MAIRDLKTHPGFAAYLILNQDGAWGDGQPGLGGWSLR